MFSSETYDVIKQRTLENIALDLDKREGSILNDFASANAMSLAKAYIDMGDILSIGFIEDSFDGYLDLRVSEFGVYRKQGKKATGEIKVVGEPGIQINNGTIVSCGDLSYVVLNDIVLPEENIIYVEALEVGTKYNLLKGSYFSLVDKPSGLTELVSEKSFSGGIDLETDEELRARFKKVVNNPATSGNKAHYESWALEIDGVSKATVYPLHAGPGTVKVSIVGTNGQPATPEIVKATQDYIDEVKPIGPLVTVVTPALFKINISANVEISTSTNVAEVKAEFTQALKDYLKDIDREVVYSKIFGILATIQGVNDFTGLIVNGGTSNVTVEGDNIPSIGDVELIEVTV